jgi:nucleotidyltransferase substrate binding protein (TIGR01987 family)
MEIEKKRESTERAFSRLREIVREPFSLIVRDTTIQRFEFTFEAVWKLLKLYLKDREGIVCNSPKSCFREAHSVGLLTEDEAVKFLEMTDDRNTTAHLYNEIMKSLPRLYMRRSKDMRN